MSPQPSSSSRVREGQWSAVATRFNSEDPDFNKLKKKLLVQSGITTGTRLGAGTFSIVLRAAYQNHYPVALKIIDTRDEGDYVRRFLPREKDLVRDLHHPNIVRVWSIMEEGPFVTFVSELCEGGDLLQRILAMTRIPEEMAKIMFRQLVAALEYLDNLHVIHRDLKCENIFLDQNDNIKLGDFGFSRILYSDSQSSTYCGSRAYVAPEILSATPYTGNVTDIWSAGVVLFVMISGLMPFDDRDPKKMLQKQVAHALRFPRSIELSTDLKKLLTDILHPLPGQRLTCKEICKSAWLLGVSPALREKPFLSTTKKEKTDQ